MTGRPSRGEAREDRRYGVPRDKIDRLAFQRALIIASTIRYARIVRLNADGSAAAEFFYKAPGVTVSAESCARLGLVVGSLVEFGPSSRSPRPADLRCHLFAERPERKAAA